MNEMKWRIFDEWLSRIIHTDDKCLENKIYAQIHMKKKILYLTVIFNFYVILAWEITSEYQISSKHTFYINKQTSPHVDEC